MKTFSFSTAILLITKFIAVSAAPAATTVDDSPIAFPAPVDSIEPPIYTPLPVSQRVNASVHIGTYNEDQHGLETRQDNNGHFRIVYCSGSHRSAQCLNWGQKAHCWDFTHDNNRQYNDAISSVYPQQVGVIWTLWEHAGCQGRALNVWGNVDNLQDYNFNDITSALSWRLA